MGRTAIKGETGWKASTSAVTAEWHGEICAFFPQSGKKYGQGAKKLLFCGRAVNGWASGLTNVDELFDLNNANRIVNRDDEIVWADTDDTGNGYNPHNSAFWRVIKRVSQEVCGADDWCNYIAWTNLYKIAPWEGGNPPQSLADLQYDWCVKIMDEELKTLKPDAVICLTSPWEKRFLESAGMDVSKNKEIPWDGYATFYQVKDGVTYIQSPHPQGKPEDSHVSAIVGIVRGEL